ncbi:MAG: NAD(P)/FAD-dependent oxidoreductase [Gemmatimonadales bacterium]
MLQRVSSFALGIVGGGVIGAACAQAAARRGLSVGLFEPGPSLGVGAASPASAGMLAAQLDPADDAATGLAVRAREVYGDLAASLKDTTGIDIGLWREGIAWLAFSDPEAERLGNAVAGQRQAGLRADWLEPEEVTERWPGVAGPPDCRGALFSPEDGAVDPRALTQALLADAQRLGMVLIPEAVEAITVADGRVRGIATRRQTVPVERVVIAAGAWSPRIRGVPRRLAVEPVRGQLAATPWPVATPPAILYSDHAYVVARGGKAILGSTMERAGFDCRPTVEGLGQVYVGAFRLLPPLATLPVEREWAGLRPVTPDGRPIVGADPEIAGLWYATGHGRNGVLLAALTGEIIGDLVATGTTSVDISSWDVTRFGPEADG